MGVKKKEREREEKRGLRAAGIYISQALKGEREREEE